MQWLRSFFQKSKPESPTCPEEDEWVELPRPLDNFKRQRDEELDRIRDLFSDRKTRPRLCALCSAAYAPGATMELLKTSRLDASKRNRIMCDVIREAAPLWKEKLVARFPVLEDIWDEHAYEKGMVGELIVFAFQASTSAQHIGLTERVLSDILWSIYLGVSRKLPMPLAIEDTELILGMVIGCAGPMIQAWRRVVEITGSIAEREGKVVSLWKRVVGDDIAPKLAPVKPEVNLTDAKPAEVQGVETQDELSRSTFQERRLMLQNLLH